MARSQNTGTVVHAWLRPEFAREVKELADRDGRSVSNLIKVALRDKLSEDFAGATPAAEAGRPPSEPSFPRSGRGAGQGEEG